VAAWRRWATMLTATACACLAVANATPAEIDTESPPVKLSQSGICHQRGTDYYERTKHFRAFDTMRLCVEAGGRPAKQSPISRGGGAREIRPTPGELPAAPPRRVDANAWLWGLVVAAGGVLAGVVYLFVRWQRRRGHWGPSDQAGAERRRWEGHRLTRADRADEQQLLSACMGDRQVMERLVRFELDREPGISRAEGIARAADRWRRDNHGSS
jgi:hypothetical protein